MATELALSYQTLFAKAEPTVYMSETLIFHSIDIFQKLICKLHWKLVEHATATP